MDPFTRSATKAAIEAMSARELQMFEQDIRRKQRNRELSPEAKETLELIAAQRKEIG